MPTMQEFWVEMKRVLVSARLAINARLSPLGLTSAAGDILFHLKGECSGLSQKELQVRISSGKAAISRTVDSLVRTGHVQRTTHPRDARACLILLTQKGQDISARVLEAYSSVFDVIRQNIPEEDLFCISRLLERIQSNLARIQAHR